MELFWEPLDHAIQQVLLGHSVLALPDQFQHLGKHVLLVDLDVDSLQTGNSHQVFTHEHLQVVLFFQSFGLVTTRADSHPQVGGLLQVGMDDLNGFFDSSGLGLVLASCIGQSVLAHFQEVVSEEQPSHWVLNGLHHLENVFENSVRSFVMALNVHTANSDEQVKSGNDVGGMLDSLVQVDHSSASSEIVLKIVFELCFSLKIYLSCSQRWPWRECNSFWVRGGMFWVRPAWARQTWDPFWDPHSKEPFSWSRLVPWQPSWRLRGVFIVRQSF